MNNTNSQFPQNAIVCMRCAQQNWDNDILRISTPSQKSQAVATAMHVPIWSHMFYKVHRLQKISRICKQLFEKILYTPVVAQPIVVGGHVDVNVRTSEAEPDHLVNVNCAIINHPT